MNGTQGFAAIVMLCNAQPQNVSGLHQLTVNVDAPGVGWWFPWAALLILAWFV